MTEWVYGGKHLWSILTPDGVKTSLDGGKKANAQIVGSPIKEGNGYTPLHGVATWSPYPEIVSILVNAETNAANIDARLGTGRTPLHVAIASLNTIEMIIALLENKANPNARDENGQTPLHLAAMRPTRDASEIIMALIKKGADGTLRDVFGKTPFDYAEKNQKITDGAFEVSDAYWELRESYWNLREKELGFDFSKLEPIPPQTLTQEPPQ